MDSPRTTHRFEHRGHVIDVLIHASVNPSGSLRFMIEVEVKLTGRHVVPARRDDHKSFSSYPQAQAAGEALGRQLIDSVMSREALHMAS